ncbi:MAG: 2-succinyl-5-enolpyruvyl-6-hydroxy-3-cyclohexene-1-carboxylic-acid synthase [Gemmatimonadota bacterium]|nr:2-succinyl-5-enolpyruvyl-6-hydroxy-3-cyclohexene-1-carboxylic-acid synthase [Gemmatimonadota bacterium]
MSHAAANTLWADAWVDELARQGIREIVVAPGSRSTPLVLAFARDGRFTLRVHLDERSAAFFALGIGKASGRPAAVVTTSGSAVANLFPAVVEAAQAETPLLLLTADRPPRLRHADANQAIDQNRFFGNYVRAFLDLGVPVSGDPELRHLRATANRAVASSVGPPAGPVHVNVPFDKPFEPTDTGIAELRRSHALAVDGRPDGHAFVRAERATRVPSGEQVDRLAALCAAPRGVIVAGPVPDPWRVGPAVLRLAARTGLPVLADPLSGARFGPAPGGVRPAAYDLLLRSPEVRAALRPTAILRVGASPTSSAVTDWLLEQEGVPYAVVDDGDRWKDHGASATDYLVADPVATLDALHGRVQHTASDDWVSAWTAADRAARTVLENGHADAVRGGPVHEGVVWPVLARAVPEATVFVSGSMPVRDLDVFGLPGEHPWDVFGNRGASGIDGIVSTAFGVATTRERPVVCVLGDLALFHDQNGLLWSREADAPVIFLLVDNDGGGIFHMLPVAEHEPAFTPYFATPHGLDFRHAAALHGLELRDVSPPDLDEALREAAARRRTVILRLRTDREENRARRSELSERAARAVLTALGRSDPSINSPW